MDSRNCADTARRSFPIHTKAATWVSAAFLYEDGNIPDKQVAAKLDQAAKWFDISDEVDKLKTTTKSASVLTDSDYAIVIKNADGTYDRRYPLRNATEVKVAAEYLQKVRDVIPLSYKTGMASKILEKASQFGAGLGYDLDDFLEKTAARGTCSAKTASDLLMTRALLVKRANPSLADELRKAASECSKNASNVRESTSLEKLACVIDQVDRDYGIAKDYGGSIQRPEDVLFAVTAKSASHFLDNHCSMTTGKIYNIGDLGRLDLDGVKDVLGEDFAREISDGLAVSPVKLAEVASTLPRPDAMLLDRLLSDSGIKPVMAESDRFGRRLTPDALAQLAEL